MKPARKWYHLKLLYLLFILPKKITCLHPPHFPSCPSPTPPINTWLDHSVLGLCSSVTFLVRTSPRPYLEYCSFPSTQLLAINILLLCYSILNCLSLYTLQPPFHLTLFYMLKCLHKFSTPTLALAWLFLKNTLPLYFSWVKNLGGES